MEDFKPRKKLVVKEKTKPEKEKSRSKSPVAIKESSSSSYQEHQVPSHHEETPPKEIKISNPVDKKIPEPSNTIPDKIKQESNSESSSDDQNDQEAREMQE